MTQPLGGHVAIVTGAIVINLEGEILDCGGPLLGEPA
jgi:hypothetical protein